MTNEEASIILRLVAVEALEGVSRFVESENNRDIFKQAYEMAIKSLEDAIPVVRCKDCKHKYYDGNQIICQKLYWCDGNNFEPSAEDFCSYGEREEE